MTVYPFKLVLGPLTITGYGLMMMVAFLMAGWAIQVDLRRRNMNEGYAADIVFAAVIGGIVGAKIWYVLLTGTWDALLSRGGFVWYGGFLGGVAGVLLNGWRKRIPARWTMELTAAPLALGYALGRVGCFLINDDYGIPSSVNEEAPHAPESVPQRQRGGGELHGPARGDALAPPVQQHPRHAAQEPAVPHEAAAAQQRVPRAREQHVPDLRPHDAADDGREHDVRGVVFVHGAAPQVDLDRPTRHQERYHHHQPVAGDGEGAEHELERIDSHCGLRIVDCGMTTGSSPGSGKSARASMVQSLRSPRARRCQPARAIMAALSAFKRGLATTTRASPARRSAARPVRVRLQATPPPSTAVWRPVARTARSSFVTSTSSTAS